MVLTLAMALSVAAVAIPAYGIYDLIDQDSKGTAEYGFSSGC